MNVLVEALYVLSNVLLVPVVLLLFLLEAYALLELGGVLREWRGRRQVAKKWKVTLRRLVVNRPAPCDALTNTSELPALVRRFAQRAATDQFHPDLVEKHANDVEIEAASRLDWLNLAVRVGPILGLIGTLIPLGPALVNLSSGDLAGMAEGLVVSFTTTVLGLLVGGVAYLLWLCRRKWYAQDLADIELLCRMWTSSEGIDTRALSSRLSGDLAEAGNR